MRRGLRLVTKDGCNRFGVRFSAKRTPPASQLVQNGPKSKLITPRIEGLATGLLRAHVRDRSQDHTLTCDRTRGIAVRQRSDLLREAKVEDLHTTPGGDQDVLRLEIAMHQSSGVGGGE